MPTKSGLSSVSCPCGASLQINPDETTQEMACPECGQTLEVVVSTDAAGRARVGILVKSGAVSTRSGGKGKGAEVHTAKCVCGAQIKIESGNIGEVYTCKACDADYTASLKQPRGGGLSTLVLRPLTTQPVAKTTRRVAPKASAPPPPPKVQVLPPPPTRTYKNPPPPPSAGSNASKEKLLMMSKGQVGAQEIGPGETGGTILCFCGEALTLKEGFAREILKCSGCGKGFRVFQAIHPRSGDPMAVMIPRG